MNSHLRFVTKLISFIAIITQVLLIMASELLKGHSFDINWIRVHFGFDRGNVRTLDGVIQWVDNFYGFCGR